MKNLSYKTVIAPIVLLFGFPKIIFGYIGPGTGLTAIGSLVACIIGLIVTVIGFLWYPIKRILGRSSQEADQVVEQAEEMSSNEDA